MGERSGFDRYVCFFGFGVGRSFDRDIRAECVGI